MGVTAYPPATVGPQTFYPTLLAAVFAGNRPTDLAPVPGGPAGYRRREQHGVRTAESLTRRRARNKVARRSRRTNRSG